MWGLAEPNINLQAMSLSDLAEYYARRQNEEIDLRHAQALANLPEDITTEWLAEQFPDVYSASGSGDNGLWMRLNLDPDAEFNNRAQWLSWQPDGRYIEDCLPARAI